MKVSIIAGGKGERLNPITKIINKHLLLIYNKPMIFYQISFLILCGFRKFLIIVIDKEMEKQIKKLLPKSLKNKISFSFKIQKNPNGIPGAMKLSKEFFKTQGQKIFLLGDNFFYGNSLPTQIISVIRDKKPAIFTQRIEDNKSFGVVIKKKDKNYFIEKPKKKLNGPAITGFYIFDEKIFNIINKLKPSKRNELEVINIIKEYEKNKNLKIVELRQGVVWFDLGTFDNIFLCSEFVKIIEKRQGIEIGNLKQILDNI